MWGIFLCHTKRVSKARKGKEILNAWIYKQIGNKVAYYRKLRDLTQEELARRIHVSISALSKVERGGYNNNIPLSLLILIAEELHIELSTLVTFNKDEKIMQQENKVKRR